MMGWTIRILIGLVSSAVRVVKKVSFPSHVLDDLLRAPNKFKFVPNKCIYGTNQSTCECILSALDSILSVF